jgi:hypothetical protein
MEFYYLNAELEGHLEEYIGDRKRISVAAEWDASRVDYFSKMQANDNKTLGKTSPT